MPISFLEDRHRAQRLGRVRLGVKKISSKTGKEYPVATPYFVLDDAPALKEFYSETPVALNIEFLWDNIEFTFPHYMRRYTASGLRCLGDGDLVLYHVNADGDVDVRDGNAVHPGGKVVMDELLLEMLIRLEKAVAADSEYWQRLKEGGKGGAD